MRGVFSDACLLEDHIQLQNTKVGTCAILDSKAPFFYWKIFWGIIKMGGLQKGFIAD